MAIVFPPEPTRIGVSIAVSAVPLSHVVETSRLAHHIRRMSRKEPKRSGGSDQNKAIARWDNEGGAPKGAPQEDRNELAPLTNEEEHILRCLGAAVIMQWNDLPTKIQRELFEHASSMGELNHTAELRVRSLDSFTSTKTTGGSELRHAGSESNASLPPF